MLRAYFWLVSRGVLNTKDALLPGFMDHMCHWSSIPNSYLQGKYPTYCSITLPEFGDVSLYYITYSRKRKSQNKISILLAAHYHDKDFIFVSLLVTIIFYKFDICVYIKALLRSFYYNSLTPSY